jgi:hypothetical protein
VGGARLNINTPRQRHQLPMEIGNFRIKDHFPQLGTKQMSYGQIGRFCLLPEFRGGANTRMLFWHLYRRAAAVGLDLVFGTAPISNARLYRRTLMAASLGFKPTIHFDIALPSYPMCEDLTFYLISVGVDKTLLDGGEPALDSNRHREEA